MKTVLIAYWTQTGSTKEAASIIADELGARGLSVTLADTASATPDNFDAVVVGSPIHGMRWASEAVGFLEKNREILSRKKTALFAVAYVYFTGRASWKRSVDDALAATYSPIAPILTGLFPGRVDKKLPGFVRLIFGIPKSATADIFDRTAIRAWVNSLADRLAPEKGANR